MFQYCAQSEGEQTSLLLLLHRSAVKEEICVKTWKDVHPSGLIAFRVMKKPSLYQDKAVNQGRQKQCSCPVQVKATVELDRLQGDLTLNQFCYHLASIISSPSPQKATLLETSIGILLEKKKIKTVTGQKKVGSSCHYSEDGRRWRGKMLQVSKKLGRLTAQSQPYSLSS